jgi:hypothetical protein
LLLKINDLKASLYKLEFKMIKSYQLIIKVCKTTATTAAATTTTTVILLNANNNHNKNIDQNATFKIIAKASILYHMTNDNDKNSNCETKLTFF